MKNSIMDNILKFIYTNNISVFYNNQLYFFISEIDFEICNSFIFICLLI